MDKTAVFFRVVPKQPESHLFEVTCTVPDPDPLGQRFSLPAWTPGSYLIRDYSRHIVALSAESEAGPLEVEKIDKDTWLCAACAGSLSVRYEVYAGELSVRTSHLDTTHGYFNGTCLFLRAHGAEERPCRVELVRPEGNRYRNWRVATALREVGAKRYEFGMYRAESYDELIDHPVEMGDFEVIAFDACGVPHEMVLSGRHSAHLPRLRKDLKILCEHHIRFFGEPAPVERYVFLVTVVGEGYGGLEHSASCSLICGRNDLPVPHDTNLTDGYRRFLGLCSHEYFHLWNVKRIKPAAFTPYNLNREVHTRLLWVFEGITSYYDDLALVRSGLINAESYLDLLGKTATRVRRVPGRFRQTLAESSFDAWTRFYKAGRECAECPGELLRKGGAGGSGAGSHHSPRDEEREVFG